MADVVSEKTFVVASSKRTLTGETDAGGEPVTRPEIRTLPAYVPFDPTLLAEDADALLADGTIVQADSSDGRRIVASVRK